MENFLIEKKIDLTIGLRSNRTETSSWINEIKSNIIQTEVGEFACRVNKEKILCIGAWKDKGYAFITC